MVYTMYAIKDELTGFDKGIYLFKNDEEAQRALMLMKKEPTSMIAMSPKDYAIYRLGTYNLEKGYITSEVEPVLILRAESIGE